MFAYWGTCLVYIDLEEYIYKEKVRIIMRDTNEYDPWYKEIFGCKGYDYTKNTNENQIKKWQQNKIFH